MVFYFIVFCFSHVISWRIKGYFRSGVDFTRPRADLLQYLELYLGQTSVKTKSRQHAVNIQLNHCHLLPCIYLLQGSLQDQLIQFVSGSELTLS